MRCFTLRTLVCSALLSGCSILPHTGGDHAFITYWPPKSKEGLKLAIKDNIDMQGVVTTDGSAFLAKTAPPAKKDAACLAIARQRHVQIVGKTNLSEFAVAPSGFNEYYGTPKNPLSRTWRRIPGGSSCGSAVAAASGVADIAFGTDTAGSVRVPAACCGIVGLKTTRHLVPLTGVYPIDPIDLDTIGPMAKDVEMTAKGMDLLESGFMAKYEAAKSRKPNASGIRVGRLYLKGTNQHIDEAVDAALAKAGFQVVRLDERYRDQWDQAKTDGDTIAAVGIYQSYQKYGGQLGISARTKNAMLLGRVYDGDKYRQALARQKSWEHTVQAMLRNVDVVALPTLQSTPPLIGLDLRIGIMDTRVLGLQNTVPVNLAGNPAISIPVPLKHMGFPVTGLQFIGRPRSEAELLNAGRLVEAALKQ